MLEIRGMDPEKVQYYGGRFLDLVRTAHVVYETQMQEVESPVEDPNHEIVINISSDDDNADHPAYTHEDVDLDNDTSLKETSHYFKPSAEVAAFNAQRKYSSTPELSHL